MTRARTVHRCAECGAEAPRWSGRCPTCSAWNALVEELREPPLVPVPAPGTGLGGGLGAGARPGPQPVSCVERVAGRSRPTGLDELDRVLAGGLVPGSVTLVAGEPGIGKSTLVVQMLGELARSGARCLLVSAEESSQQVRLRAERLGALEPDLWLFPAGSLPAIVGAVGELEPDVLVVDSIQTIAEPALGSAPGTVAQVRECARQLAAMAKDRGLTTVLVGHVNKEGAIAGPRVLEHLVDTVLTFEGERHHALRMLRAVKHRFGPTGDLGLFEMTEAGLVGVPDPSGLFLGDRRGAVPGSVVVPAMEGHRPLLVELQALVAPNKVNAARRSAQGLDTGRLDLLVAVLQRRVGLRFGGDDVYASVVGGVRVVEPAADLALGLALASALSGVAVPATVVACGEVGLSGEVRQVPRLDARLAEASRLGFREALVPASAPPRPGTIQVLRVASLAQAVDDLGLRP